MQDPKDSLDSRYRIVFVLKLEMFFNLLNTKLEKKKRGREVFFSLQTLNNKYLLFIYKHKTYFLIKGKDVAGFNGNSFILNQGCFRACSAVILFV